jgi:hypothetical protein
VSGQSEDEKERRGCVYLVDVGDAQAGEGVQQHLDIIRLEIDQYTDTQGERGSEAGVRGGN